MDVPRDTFLFHLPNILGDLTSCSFVSLDLEFSGIPLHAPRDGKQKLQEWYAQTKEAAERYQVLQVGLTIAKEDLTSGTYILKPYNFHLSPIIDQKLEVERTWSYQSNAVDFLMANKFRMQAPFEEGVYYISREEEKQAMEKILRRQDRSVERSLIDIPESDTESLEFLVTVREAIDAWLAKKKVDNYLNIPPPLRKRSRDLNLPPSVLNRFQRRLVHQLVEAEYPALVTIGRPGFVQIIRYDEVREKAVDMERIRRTEERILRQMGFRWIAEALTGGDLSKLDPKIFSHLVREPKGITKERALKEFAETFKQQLKPCRPVLVGHNLFLDLIYFCECFFGNLPERVEDFLDFVHELFPLLIDTKYMATHECGSINPSSSLAELHDTLKGKTKPDIVVHPQHSKYESQELSHEAGYDSLLTAQVFIKLSSQLYQESFDVVDGPKPIKAVDPLEGPPPSILSEVETLSDEYKEEEGEKGQNQPQPPREAPTRVLEIRPRFAHGTKFDALADTVETVSDETEVGSDDNDFMEKVAKGELIPRFESEFWNTYGNKLRVFGTEERVCMLGGTTEPKAAQIT